MCIFADEGKEAEMHFLQRSTALAILILACCHGGTGQPAELPPPPRAATIRQGVQAFMQGVARDVTREGAVAWCKYFDDNPEFFMAVNGKLMFSSGADAQKGTQEFAHTIRRIDLKWGNDLRIDPITPELAVVGVSWREVWVDNANHRIDEAGYFTAVAQFQKGQWKFRDVHWSEPLPTAVR
jgi:hypothetical protein